MVTMDTITVPGYQVFLLQQLQHMQTEQALCDVQLKTQEGHVTAHSLMLMAASPYLQTIISRQGNHSQPKEMVTIYFDNTPLSVLQTVVHFMYSGELSFARDNIEQIVNICEQLNLASAVKASQEFLATCRTRTSVDKDTDSVVDKGESVDVTAEKINQKHVRKTGKRSKLRTSNGIFDSEENEPPDKKQFTAKTSKSDEADKKTAYIHSKKSNTVSQKTKKIPKVTIKNINTDITKSVKRRKAKGKKNVKNGQASGLKNKVDFTDIKDKNNCNYEIKLEIDYDGYNDDHDHDHGDTADMVDCSDSEKLEKLPEDRNTTNHKEVKKRPNKSGKNVISATGSEKKENKGRRKRFPCSMCDRILTSHKRLVFHLFSKHGNPYDEKKYLMYPCKEEGCQYVAASRHNLDTHMKSRHGLERPHICEFCGKSFKLPNVLATHLNIHTGKKLWKCDTCGDSFNQQSGLVVHIKRHHIGESSWAELCHLCSEKFLQKSELAWHLYKTHNQPLPDRYKAYICCICNYQTKSSQDLLRHQNAHEGIKQFTCSICKKACSTKSELKRHMSFHGEKKFKCTFEACTYACTDSIGLKKHIKLMHTHKNYKPYICPVCPYKTGVKGNLDKHIRTVHNLEVVTKHTIQLKMKYSDFQSGDIITKDGNLVASAQDRKALQDQYHAENPEMFDNNVDYIHEASTVSVVDKDVDEPILFQTTTAKSVSNYNAYSDTMSSAQSNLSGSADSISTLAHSTSGQSELRQFTPLANYIYVEGSHTIASVGLPVAAEDLRISMASQVPTSSSLFRDSSGGAYVEHKLQTQE